MTFRYAIKYRSYDRKHQLFEKTVRVRGKNREDALRKFREKFGNIKVIAVDGVPVEVEKNAEV